MAAWPHATSEMAGCRSKASKGRNTKFNKDILEATDPNGDVISVWCRQMSEDSGFCTMCNQTISCKQHGVSAIMRHATNKRHIEATRQHRDASGLLKRQSTIQSCLDFTPKMVISPSDLVTQAETIFVVGMTLKGVPYSWADTATMLYPKMFPDSEVAKKFSCKRSKASYIVSDGLGPHFKQLVVDELNRPDTFYSIAIDETPIPEQRCQQMDVVVRYYSSVAKRVLVEHLDSCRLGSCTADILVGEVKRAIQDLPQNNLICVFSDGPNVMKSFKAKMKEVNPHILDVGDCCLHKVHNSFGRGLDAFGSDVEAAVVDAYYFLKSSAVRSSSLKAHQEAPGLPENVFLRHLNSRWLTLGPAVGRFIEQFDAIKNVVLSSSSCRSGGKMRARLAEAFSDKAFYAKLLFVNNAFDLFKDFLTLFQGTETLVHCLFGEMVALVHKLCGRFMKAESYNPKTGKDLLLLQPSSSVNWKSKVEVGEDTEAAMASWEAAEKRAFRLGARSFYIKCTEYLLSRLPLDNTNLESLRCLHPDAQGRETSACDLRLLAARLPQVIEASKISALMDEFTLFQLEPIETFSLSVDQHWQKVFELKKADGSAKYPLLCKVIKALLCIPHGNADLERGFSENRRMLLERARLTIHNVNGIRQILSHAKRFGGDPSKFVVTPTIIKAVQGSSKRYRERIAAEESVAKRRCTDSSKSSEKDDAEQAVQAEVETAKKMICNAELLIGRGVKSKDFGDIESGHSLLAEGKSRLASALAKLTCAKKRSAT
nr:uncharacterized protein LOC119159479 [Rhipicephalus microplus]